MVPFFKLSTNVTLLLLIFFLFDLNYNSYTTKVWFFLKLTFPKLNFCFEPSNLCQCTLIYFHMVLPNFYKIYSRTQRSQLIFFQQIYQVRMVHGKKLNLAFAYKLQKILFLWISLHTYETAKRDVLIFCLKTKMKTGGTLVPYILIRVIIPSVQNFPWKLDQKSNSYNR